MARAAISTTAWTSWGTTTKDTLFNVEGGQARLYTGSTAGVDRADGHLLTAGFPVIVPTGLAVSLWAEGDGVVVTSIDFGT
jgi:hypothetical protein